MHIRLLNLVYKTDVGRLNKTTHKLNNAAYNSDKSTSTHAGSGGGKDTKLTTTLPTPLWLSSHAPCEGEPTVLQASGYHRPLSYHKYTTVSKSQSMPNKTEGLLALFHKMSKYTKN